MMVPPGQIQTPVALDAIGARCRRAEEFATAQDRSRRIQVSIQQHKPDPGLGLGEGKTGLPTHPELRSNLPLFPKQVMGLKRFGWHVGNSSSTQFQKDVKFV